MREMSEKARMKKVLDVLSKLYPDVKIQLEFTTPFELLVATILSAQCTDARVNIVTKSLFQVANTPSQFALMEQEELEHLIYSTGFYKAKAKNIIEMSKKLIGDNKGKVPSSLEELIKLPGVGRKTANVVLGHCYGIPAIVVDTHVIRITNKLAFTNTENPDKIEDKLKLLIPKNQWVIFTHYFINHGRKICVARRPKCGECSISGLCPSAIMP